MAGSSPAVAPEFVMSRTATEATQADFFVAVECELDLISLLIAVIIARLFIAMWLGALIAAGLTGAAADVMIKKMVIAALVNAGVAK